MIHFYYCAIFIICFAFTSLTNAAPPIVASQPLEKIATDSIGVINQKDGGLERRIWQGTSYDIALTWFEKLPHPASPTLEKLTFRLLASESLPPPAGDKEGRLLYLRMLKLMALKRYDTVIKMMAYIPASVRTDKIEQLYVTSLLLSNKTMKACSQAQKNAARFNTHYWQRMQVVCFIRTDQLDKASLTLAVLQEDGHSFEDGALEKILTPSTKKPPIENLLALLQLEVPFSDVIQQSFEVKPEIQQLVKSLLQQHSRQWDDTIAYQWKRVYRRWNPDQYRRLTSRFFAALEQFGYRVPVAQWQVLAAIPSNEQKSSLNYPIIKQLQYASRAKKVGETLLLVVNLFEGKHPAQVSDVTLSEAVKSLIYIGFEDEARGVVLEALGEKI